MLYLNDRFKQIEQSLKDNHTSYISIKNLSQKSTIRLLVKDYEVKDILTKQVLDKFNSLTFISGTLTFNHSFDAFKNWFNDHTEFNTYEVSTSMTAAKIPTYLFLLMLHHTIIRTSKTMLLQLWII